MDDADGGGILSIQLSDSDDDAAAVDQLQKRADRTAQTEADFQAVKRDYRAKVENGEIYRSLELPLGPGPANKQHVQDVLHAVEELYFFQRYQHALDFVDSLRADRSTQALDDDARRLLLVYREKCRQKLNASS